MSKEFSIYQSEKGIYEKVPTGRVKLEFVNNLIRSNELKEATERVRSVTGELRDKEKTKLQYCTFNGVFTSRANKNLEERSEYFCADLDHIGDVEAIKKVKDQICECLTPALMFISPSGDGLKIIFQINPEFGTHLQFFHAIQSYIKRQTGRDIDEKCKDIARACFLCYDPTAELEETPSVLSQKFIADFSPKDIKEEPAVHKEDAPAVVTNEEKVFQDALRIIEANHPYKNGNRNAFLTALAGKCHRDGISEQFTLSKCLEYAQDGFSEGEIQATVKSIYSNPAYTGITKPEDYSELLKKFSVDFTKEPEQAPAILYIKNGNKLIPLFTLQDISLISGKAKSRKTFLTVLLVASYLGYINGLIEADPDRQGTVLIFDTEQSPYHLHKMMKRICTLISIDNPERLRAYGLKTLTPEEKVKFIDYAIQNTPGVTLIVIDGIRDLVFDINSPEEATKTSVRLMKWAAENNIHIINILHQNKGDGNARGHLGTELVNKAQMVLSVNKESDKTISTVDAEYARDMEFDSFSFMINDETSLPELCSSPSVDKTKQRTEPSFIPHEMHRKILEQAFKGDTERKYKDACTEIKLRFTEEGVIFGESRSRDYLAYYIKDGWIEKNESNKTYRATL